MILAYISLLSVSVLIVHEEVRIPDLDTELARITPLQIDLKSFT